MARRHTYRLALIGMGAFLSSATVATAAQVRDAHAAQDLREFLATGYATGVSALNDCRIHMETEGRLHPKLVKKHASLKFSRSYHRKTEYVRKGSRQRLCVESVNVEGPGKGKSRTNMRICDGMKFLRYMATTGIDDSKAPKATADIKAATESARTQMIGGRYSAVFDLLGHEQAPIVGEAILDPNVLVYPEMHTLNGLACYKADLTREVNGVTYNTSYWVCAERSCMPLKVEIRTKDGFLRSRYEVKEFEKLSTGSWLPEHIVCKYWVRDRETGGRLLATEQEHTLTSIELKPQVEDDVFSTAPDSLPDGTLIRDRIAGLEYTLGEGPVSDARVERIIDRAIDTLDLTPGTQAVAGVVPNAPRDAAVLLLDEQGVRVAKLPNPTLMEKGGQSFRWIIIPTGVCLIGGGLLMLCRQHRRRRELLGRIAGQ